MISRTFEMPYKGFMIRIITFQIGLSKGFLMKGIDILHTTPYYVMFHEAQDELVNYTDIMMQGVNEKS